MSRTKTVRSRRSLPAILAALLMLFGIPAVTTVVTATPAAAVGSYNNADIADYALTKVGETGGQCRAFVNMVIDHVSGGVQQPYTSGGKSYFQTLLDAGGTRITDINSLVKGDVVQKEEWATSSGLHTWIIVSRVNGNTFNVVDSNHSSDEKVQNYDRTFTLSDTTRAYRMGTVTTGGGGTTPPPDADNDGVSDTDDWCPIVAGSSVNKGCPNDITQISGDVDGDSKDDVIYVSRGTDNAPGLGWFKSTSGATPSLADATSAGVSLPAPAWNVYHLKWTVGDFNGDGKDDLFVMSGSPVDPPAMYMLSSNGNGFNSPVLVKQPNPAYWIWERLQLKAADVDGDGKDDILAISRGTDNAPGLSWLRSTSTATTPSLADPVSAGVSLPAPGWNTYNLKWTVGDFNGDGKDDLFVMSGSQSDPPAMYILGSTGSGLAAPTLVKQPNPAYWQWTRLQVMAADKDGDGKDDVIYVSRGTNNEAAIGWLRSTSSGTTMSLADGIGLSTPGSGWLVPNLKWAITDVDGDGKDDLFACSGSQSDPPSLYVFKATATGLDNPALVKQPNPAYWIWERLQF